MINDAYDNSFYDLWTATNVEKDAKAEARAKKLGQMELNCINYKNVNQCMSVCQDTADCSGFVVTKQNDDLSGRCCLMVNPPLNTHRHSFDVLPDNADYVSYRYLNNLMRTKAQKEGLPVFDKVRFKDNNSGYATALDRTTCHRYCPKCILGRCPDNYRCVDYESDPRYNQTCVITNEDRYDESQGLLFDDPKIKPLDEVYGLNEYAGYDDINLIPIKTVPHDYKLDLTNSLIPNVYDGRTWTTGPVADVEMDALDDAERRDAEYGNGYDVIVDRKVDINPDTTAVDFLSYPSAIDKSQTNARKTLDSLITLEPFRSGYASEPPAPNSCRRNS